MQNSIIGRKEGIALLEKYMSSNHSEFIAIYGRRRVGKTFLIRQYFQNQFAFDMTGIIEGKKAEQLTAFSHAMKQHGYKGRKPATWLIGRRGESFRTAIQTHYGIVPTLITTFGLSRGMYADSIHASVVLDDLFSD